MGILALQLITHVCAVCRMWGQRLKRHLGTQQPPSPGCPRSLPPLGAGTGVGSLLSPRRLRAPGSSPFRSALLALLCVPAEEAEAPHRSPHPQRGLKQNLLGERLETSVARFQRLRI